jgi:hypothetical protein
VYTVHKYSLFSSILKVNMLRFKRVSQLKKLPTVSNFNFLTRNKLSSTTSPVTAASSSENSLKGALRPLEIIHALDKHIVGQADAKVGNNSLDFGPTTSILIV